MKVGMKDLDAMSFQQFAEAFLTTAIDHWWSKLLIINDDEHKNELLRMTERLTRIKSELTRYNNILDNASDKTIRPDVQAKVGEFMVMIIAVIEQGFKDMGKVEKMLRNVGFVTDGDMSRIKTELEELR